MAPADLLSEVAADLFEKARIDALNLRYEEALEELFRAAPGTRERFRPRPKLGGHVGEHLAADVRERNPAGLRDTLAEALQVTSECARHGEVLAGHGFLLQRRAASLVNAPLRMTRSTSTVLPSLRR